MKLLLSRFQHSSIRVRLGLAFGIQVLLLLACATFGVQRLASFKIAMQSILDREARASVLSTQLVSQAHETSRTLAMGALADSVDLIELHLKRVATLRADSQLKKQQLSEALGSTIDRTNLDEVATAEPAYLAGMDKVAVVIKGADSDAARIALNDLSLRKAETAYLAALEKLDTQLRLAMEQTRTQAEATYAQSRNLLLGAAALAAALGTILGVGILRSLIRQLGAEPAIAAALAKSVAQGDLSVLIRLQNGDHASLMASLKAMRDSLLQVVSAVRQNAEFVVEASQHMAGDSQDLAQRTEQQAEALQQTAATMSRLDLTVRNSANSVTQANQLALGASDVAIKGGEVVGQVVETMKGINDSSRKIADIVNVINGIAFQTNILALNAAVEAARAGEQGRGFAVVAGEVRSLALRSADAAREIKELIATSVERVEMGTLLVDRAGMTMAEIVTAIQRVTGIMGEISEASSEQSIGVAQVSRAVTQIDQATKQNAKLVEDSAAASESLSQRAQQLVSDVAGFKISD